MIRAKIKGLDRLNRKFRQLPIESKRAIAGALGESALLVEGEAKRTIQRGSRSGTIRRATKGGKTHQASAPGEPPKTDTGRLVASIASTLDPTRLIATVGTNLRYGKFLEFGTTKMAARPWLFPTFERLKPRIRKLVAQAQREANRKIARK